MEKKTKSSTIISIYNSARTQSLPYFYLLPTYFLLLAADRFACACVICYATSPLDGNDVFCSEACQL